MRIKTRYARVLSSKIACIQWPKEVTHWLCIGLFSLSHDTEACDQTYICVFVQDRLARQTSAIPWNHTMRGYQLASPPNRQKIGPVSFFHFFSILTTCPFFFSLSLPTRSLQSLRRVTSRLFVYAGYSICFSINSSLSLRRDYVIIFIFLLDL